MAINPSLLIAAAILQDYFVDKDTGKPLAAGIVTCYTDYTMTTLKPWYTQTGTHPTYTYDFLPNPMTLSAVGTIQDVDGNDVIPYFYPYKADNITFEPYFITVQNADGELQFTRANFPFVAPEGQPSTLVPTNQNLIVNNVFWRNAAIAPNTAFDVNALMNNTITIGSTNLLYGALAPSQHDGHIMPDILLFKNTKDSTETVSFNTFAAPSSQPTFPDNKLIGDITPELYMNITCTSGGTETVRYIQIPLNLHIKSLSGYTNGYLTLQAYSASLSATAIITAGIFQFAGTGAPVQATPVTQQIVLGTDWNKSVINLPIPTAQNITLGAGGDDALYLQIGLPAGISGSGGAFNINIALPQFYLGNSIPTNSFQTYDEVNAIISSPRTGDIRIANNGFWPYGWTPMNDGVIALNTPTGLPISRVSQDTWLLYNLLWNIAKPYDTGSNFNALCQIYTTGGAATNYGVSAYADFTANKALQLTRIMGKVLLGTVPITALTNLYKTTFTAISSGGLAIVCANNVSVFNGMPIAFTNTGGALPTGIVANAVYYVANFGGTNAFNVATTFANALAGVVISFTDSGTGTHTVSSAVLLSSEGEYGHTQLLTELAAHFHIPNVGSSSFRVAVGIGGINNTDTSAGNNSNLATQTNTVGSSAPFNVTQPGTFVNMFIKL